MMDQLDLLLERTREPEPSDDLFVTQVLQTIRADASRSLHRTAGRRFVTRPIVLAAAAVVVFGGAVAAVVSTTQPQRTHDDTTRASRVAAPSVRDVVPPAGGGTIANQPSAGTVAAEPKIYRRGDLEWGYTSPHSSYVLDRKTGLRLGTETHDNAFAVGKRHGITVELSNTGKHPISLQAPEGCALQVMGYSGRQPAADASGFQPRASRDGSQATAWKCAGSNADPRSDEPSENIVLAPGDRRVAITTLVFDKKTSWTVLGLCRCSYVDASQPEPPPVVNDPLRGLNGVTRTDPLLSFTEPLMGDADVSGFFAPPIGLRPA
jgi:hypothetical protein